MQRLSFSSLRVRAIILVIIAIFPVLALTLYSYLEHQTLAVKEVQRDAVVVARNLAALHGVLISNSRQLLAALARSPQVQNLEPQACAALFTQLLRGNESYTALLAADLQGKVFASFPAHAPELNVSHRLWFQQVLQTMAFSIGKAHRGRISGKYTIPLAYPIIDELGQLKGVLTAGIDLGWLGNLMIKSDLPPGTALILAENTGEILFHYPDPPKYVGRMLPERLMTEAMKPAGDGVVQAVDLLGDMRLYDFARLAPPFQEMYLAIGIPRELAFAQVSRDLWRNLLGLGLVALVALAAAWCGGDIFISREVNKLLQVTQHLTNGDLAARTGPSYKSGELGALARSFDQMADSIQERDARLKNAAQELEQRILELDRRTAQLEASNKELESFSYSVSHDLRAPLRGIAGFSRILLDECSDKLDAEGIRYLNIIQGEVRKMGNLIDDLLALSRFGRKELKPAAFEMQRLVEAVGKELQEQEAEKKVEIRLAPLPPAWGDRDMIRQVLWNLMANAFKFTRPRETAVIEISGRAGERENVYCVQDNGVGFDMEYGDKIFEAFQRLHSDKEFEGTGMGLAIARRIMQRHDGRIWAEGKVGEGAKFYFALPKGNSGTEGEV